MDENNLLLNADDTLFILNAENLMTREIKEEITSDFNKDCSTSISVFVHVNVTEDMKLTLMRGIKKVSLPILIKRKDAVRGDFVYVDEEPTILDNGQVAFSVLGKTLVNGLIKIIFVYRLNSLTSMKKYESILQKEALF